jgi:uncharacterized protein (TIGR02466 family)
MKLNYDIFTFPPIYVFHYTVPNHQQIKAEVLPKILAEYEEKHLEESYRWHPGSKSGVTTNYNTSSINLLTEEQHVDIIWNALDIMLSIFYADDSILRPCKQMPTRSVINACWWNVYNKGDYVELHNHAPAGVSGFYILDLPDEHENGTVFQATNPYALSHKIDMWNDTHTTSHLKEGDVVLFPSSLRHYVNPSEGRKVSISFNIDLLFES